MLLADGRNQDRARKLTGHPTELGANRAVEIDAIADQRGLVPKEAKRNVTMSEIIREGHPLGRNSASGEAIWRYLSGVSHSDMRASFAMTSNDPVSETATGVITANVSMPITTIADLTGIAVARTEHAIGLYDDRRTPHVATIGS